MLHAVNVTPSDTANLPVGTEAISFAYTGSTAPYLVTLQITTLGNEVVQITLPSGYYPIRCTRVWNTGTQNLAAGSLVAYWT